MDPRKIHASIRQLHLQARSSRLGRIHPHARPHYMPCPCAPVGRGHICLVLWACGWNINCVRSAGHSLRHLGVEVRRSQPASAIATLQEPYTGWRMCYCILHHGPVARRKLLCPDLLHRNPRKDSEQGGDRHIASDAFHYSGCWSFGRHRDGHWSILARSTSRTDPHCHRQRPPLYDRCWNQQRKAHRVSAAVRHRHWLRPAADHHRCAGVHGGSQRHTTAARCGSPLPTRSSPPSSARLS